MNIPTCLGREIVIFLNLDSNFDEYTNKSSYTRKYYTNQ
jgi:hypothetical protein